jgi:hypothetical protein
MLQIGTFCRTSQLLFVGALRFEPSIGHEEHIGLYSYSKTNQIHNISNLFYFWSNTLHVSDGLSVHHQESKTVHTALGICTVLDF